jgi:alanyl-tRNA synthetase
LHINLTPGPRDLDIPAQIEGRNLVNKGDARCIEIWNLVFIQFNANPDGTFVDLPAKHVDTGMGFERVCSMMQGTKGFTDFSVKAKISNYETDVFRPLFDELEKITGFSYKHTLPRSVQEMNDDEKIDVAFRVIADHIRTLSFSIADGIQPSNEGRGYVLRRILRRAFSYGRNIGSQDPFLYKLVKIISETMGNVFQEVREREKHIEEVIRNEEISFNRTLDTGMTLFNEVVGRLRNVSASIFPGDIAFKLHDTYGFPIDLTELKARECNLTVDINEFTRLMDDQKAKGKAAQKKEIIVAQDVKEITDDSFKYEDVHSRFCELKTKIEGYGQPVGESGIDMRIIIPEKTQFYASMGGQVSDIGHVKFYNTIVEIVAAEKIAEGVLHQLKHPLRVLDFNEEVTLVIDAPRRAKIEAHHSGTHLLNWALRKVLGNTITQKGSYVGPDRLRFDFSHGTAVTKEQLAEIETLINEKIEANVPAKWEERPYAEVKGDPSILQFFGDKYGEMVRVVSIGDFSKELCGGTHVRESGKVGYFKILHEAAIAAGIRRIEAASGPGLIEHVREGLLKQEEQHSILRQRKLDLAALKDFSGEETPHARWKHWEAREETLRQAGADIAQHEKEEAKRQEAGFQKRAGEMAPQLIASAQDLNGTPFIALLLSDAPAAFLPVLADALKSRWQGIAVLATTEAGKVALLCAVAPAHTKKVQAGKIIQAIAPLVGGKGGGRPELAQGGGTNPDGVAAALAKAEEIVRAALA